MTVGPMLSISGDGGRVLTVGERLWMLWRYHPRLVGLAVRRGASRDDAEDLAMLAILRCATSKNIDEGEKADLWPYLAATIVNLMVDEYRRDRRQANARHYLPRPRSIEEDVAIRDAAARTLHRLVETEQPETAAMVVDHAVNQLTWEELGGKFSLSASAARFRVRRAVHRLRTWAIRGLD